MRHLFLILSLCLLFSCGPAVRSTILQPKETLAYDSEVLILNEAQETPQGAEYIADLKVGDGGFSTQCDWERVIQEAELEARKLGGNLIKITEHKTPNAMSSCHRIKAKIYWVSEENLATISASVTASEKGTFHPDWDYARIFVYRFGGPGGLIGYDVNLGETFLGRIKANSAFTAETQSYGEQVIWAKTESRAELPLVIEKGYEYYINCGIAVGVLVGRPTLEKVGASEGESARLKFNQE